MDSPPTYSPPQERQEPVPPYRAFHAFANEAEELTALNEFAQSKLYVNPGTDGTLPDVAAGLRWSAAGNTDSNAAKQERQELREMEKLRKAEKKQQKGNKVGFSQKLKKIVSRDKEQPSSVIR